MSCVYLALLFAPHWNYRPRLQSKSMLSPIAEIHIQISFNPIPHPRSQSKSKLNPIAEIYIQIPSNPIPRLKSSKWKGLPLSFTSWGNAPDVSAPYCKEITLILHIRSHRLPAYDLRPLTLPHSTFLTSLLILCYHNVVIHSPALVQC